MYSVREFEEFKKQTTELTTYEEFVITIETAKTWCEEDGIDFVTFEEYLDHRDFIGNKDDYLEYVSRTLACENDLREMLYGKPKDIEEEEEEYDSYWKPVQCKNNPYDDYNDEECL